jgi:hypothetical protein
VNWFAMQNGKSVSMGFWLLSWLSVIKISSSRAEVSGAYDWALAASIAASSRMLCIFPWWWWQWHRCVTSERLRFYNPSKAMRMRLCEKSDGSKIKVIANPSLIANAFDWLLHSSISCHARMYILLGNHHEIWVLMIFSWVAVLTVIEISAIVAFVSSASKGELATAITPDSRVCHGIVHTRSLRNRPGRSSVFDRDNWDLSWIFYAPFRKLW